MMLRSKVSIFAVVCLFTVGGCDREKEYDAAEFGLKPGDGCRKVKKTKYLRSNLHVVWTYKYEDGRRVRIEHDRGGDGTLDWVTNYGYDDAGRRVRTEVDKDQDGTAETLYRTTYNDAGDPVRVEVDGGALGDIGGEPERVVTHEYDDRGNRVRTEVDRTSGGRVVDGTPDAIRVRTFDDQGNRVRQTEYLGDDTSGEHEEIIRYRYDEQGRRVRLHEIGNRLPDSKGRGEKVVTYHYNERGDRVRAETYGGSEAKGPPTSTTKYAYACPPESG